MVFLTATEILLKKQKTKNTPGIHEKTARFWTSTHQSFLVSPSPKNVQKKLLFLTLLEKEFEIPCLQQLLNSALPTYWNLLVLLKSSDIWKGPTTNM